MTTSRFKREELHTAVARAIAPWTDHTDESLDPGECPRCLDASAKAIRVVLTEAQRIVREFPLNICGYGGPMPTDHAVSIEQFRDAVLAALGEHA